MLSVRGKISVMLLYIFVAAVILTLLTFAFTGRYSISLVSTDQSSVKSIKIFADLNGDGISEKIECQQYSELRVTVTVYEGEQIIFHHPLAGLLTAYNPVITEDIDNDHVEEIFFFTVNNDSLCLNCIDYTGVIETENLAFCKLSYINNQYQYEVWPGGLYDVNSDGMKEFYFSVMTGFETRPRAVFAFFPGRNKIISSPESCALLHDLVLYDIDNDGNIEVLSNSSATGNCDINREYPDQYSWFMVFTPDLKFKFPPVKFDSIPAETKVIPYKTAAGNLILVLHRFRGKEKYESFMAFYDIKGNLLKKRILTDEEKYSWSYLFSFDNDYSEVFLLQTKGKIYRIGENLQFIEQITIAKAAQYNPYYLIDIDNDGKKELIVRSPGEKELMIYRNDFSNPVTLSFPYKLMNSFFSVKTTGGKETFLALDTMESFYIYRYGLSFISRFWYFTFVVILAGCLLFYFLFSKIGEFRRIKRANTRNQLSELQLKSIQNQIDPHFTFNLLESFESLLNEHNNDRAEYIFNKYSGLLKTTVLNSDKVMIPLKEELEFIRSWLDLEKFRYDNRFDYEIHIEKHADTELLIPKMLVHIFAENAVKHGLKHREHPGGKLLITVNNNNGDQTIRITDNGIGRKKAAEIHSFSTGKGLMIADKMLDLNMSLNKTKITYKIEDLYFENNPSGTEIIITLPV